MTDQERENMHHGIIKQYGLYQVAWMLVDARARIAELEAELPWKVVHCQTGGVAAAFKKESVAEFFLERCGSALYYTIAGPGTPPDRCPGCGEPTEYDREDPPSPYYCDKCQQQEGDA